MVIKDTFLYILDRSSMLIKRFAKNVHGIGTKLISKLYNLTRRNK